MITRFIFFKLYYFTFFFKDPFDRDITITLKNDGIRLYFEPNIQLLKVLLV